MKHMEFKNLFLWLAGLSLTCSYDDLSYHKAATQFHTRPSYMNMYVASSAIDRNITTCMRTYSIGDNTPDKQVWWKVDLGAVYSIYSITILFKNYNGYENRQRGRFAGFSLYVSNTGDIQGSSLCYKNGPQLPPLNFTTTCTEYGRYIIFYNERLDGVTYPDGYETQNVFTELCEVIVQGCNKHTYDRGCKKSCPTNCKNSICHIQHGTCYACKTGWVDASCNTKCSEGLYGVNCSQECKGHCRGGITCNHVTGLCDKGCAAGWTGLQCKKECDDGTYGYACVNNCSGHCINGSLCNKETGYCHNGCNAGYTNKDCSRECVKAYGENCQYPCNQHCINQTCDRFTGKCLSWCQEGFYGERCNQEIQHRGHVTPWIVAFSIVLFIVVILMTSGFVCFWILYKKLFSGNIRLLWKSLFRENVITITDKTTNYIEPNNYQDLNPNTNSNYQDLKPNTDYQELKVQYGEENQYQNTTL